MAIMLNTLEMVRILGPAQANLLHIFTTYIVFLLIEKFDVSECTKFEEVDRHLELGKQFLAKNQLTEALSHYHEAVDGDPSNYLTYFRRGTVFLALGKAKNAIADFDKVLEIKPDFVGARISRGIIHLKQANYDLAQLDFYNVLKADPYHQEATEYFQKIDPAQERLRLAEYYYGNNDYLNAINLLTEVIESSPWAAHLYELRSEMYLENGDEISAISDIRSATKLQSDNTAGYYKLSTMLYKLGHASDALKAIRECLKLDPEHKDCFSFYKRIKRIEKYLVEAETDLENGAYQDGIASALAVLEKEKNERSIIFEAKKLLCTLYMKDEQNAEALEACGEVLAISEDPAVYCDRAEAYLNSEMFDDAIRDYKSALEINAHFDKAKEGLKQAENRQKQSEKRDYYKILDVKRSATKKEIVKAYRKMAQKWHPDNFATDEKMKKIAEKKFIDIAAAKEVLTDDEKRRQFDSGEDPLDPESGRGGMPNFQHFQNFHGSPFQFRFHFN